jgi:hypothetical protein
MPSLSFDDRKGSKAIAIVKGGDMNGEILFLHEDDFKGKKPKRDFNPIPYMNELKKLKMKPNERTFLMSKIEEALKNNEESIKEKKDIRNLYGRIKQERDNDKTVFLDDDSMFNLIPSPDPNKREVYYIAGASGSGKSYIAKGLAEGYKKLFPQREIYLISKLKEDETLDNMKVGKPKRINIESFLTDYPELDEFKDCMVIFDDYDTITGKLGDTIQKIIDDLAIQGRHTNTTMLCLTHYITNYKKTRLLLNEATHYVVYPQSTSFSNLKYLLGHHVGLSKEEVKDLKKMGRWVAISKNYPQYLISSHQAKILNQE